MNELCNCGKPTCYSHMVEGELRSSCNKHMMCATYSDLKRRLIGASANLMRHKAVLRKIVDQDAEGYQYKAWAKEVLDAEAQA